MTEQLKKDNAEILDTDIVFDCPHCTKSLVIDQSAAGMRVQCTDCGEAIEVPGGEEEEEAVQEEASALASEDSSTDAFAAALLASQQKVQELVTEKQEINKRRMHLEDERMANANRFKQISREMSAINAASERIMNVLRSVEPGSKS